MEERYSCDKAGRRVLRECLASVLNDGMEGMLRYDAQGRLAGSGNTSLHYDRRGALSEQYDRQGQTRFFYGKDTMLDRVLLPSGEDIRYEYSRKNPLGPARKFRHNALVTECLWLDPLRLGAYRDYEDRLEYALQYDEAGVLDRVRVTPLAAGEQREDEDPQGRGWLKSMAGRHRRARLESLFKEYGDRLDLLCGCDQVGTPKVLTNMDRKKIKSLRYDNFGVLRHDTLPDLFLPVGFAGGLLDRDTGLVRFGWRDYEPRAGRFTAPDPLGDTGGDHDLYEYCVDDPVSCVDPDGLWTRETFDESRVSRDDQGQFATGGAGSREGKGERTWKEPDFLDKIFPLIRLDKEHPYRRALDEAIKDRVVGRRMSDEEKSANWEKLRRMYVPFFADHDSSEFQGALGAVKKSMRAFGNGLNGAEAPSIDPYIWLLALPSRRFRDGYNKGIDHARKQ